MAHSGFTGLCHQTHASVEWSEAERPLAASEVARSVQSPRPMNAWHGWEWYEVGQPPRAARRAVPGLSPGEVWIRTAGCGVCHTDVGFAFEGVRTRHPFPLVLGHEISGVVEAAGADHEDLVGKPVVVPAVLPCGQCADCLGGHPHICRAQIMPGNDLDGGFATHVTLPGRWVCPVVGGSTDPDAPIGALPGLTLRHLAVVADAVSTPYQAVERSGLEAGDLAVVVGLGGVGGYAARIARARGARVVGLDVDRARLDGAEALGCGAAFDPRAHDAKGLRDALRDFAKGSGARPNRWRIFECSGTTAGQKTAFGLINHGATLSVVGFTMDPVEIRLSNLMAFDARAIGNWGCDPALYPAIVADVLAGRIDVVAQTEIRPLASIAETFEEAHRGHLRRRVVLAP